MRIRSTTLITTALISLLVVGCAGEQKDVDVDNQPVPGVLKTYSGIYVEAYEVRQFLPTGVLESWWLKEGAGMGRAFYNTSPINYVGTPNARIARVVIRGRVTDLGVFSAGEVRELHAAEVIDVTPATAEEYKAAVCELPAPGWADEQMVVNARRVCDSDEPVLVEVQ